MGFIAAFGDEIQKDKIGTMNILIIGEFSAFAKHLKNGFKKLGHQVTIVHTGDTYKKIDSDDDDVLFKVKNIAIKGHHFKGSERLLSPLTNRVIQKDIKKMFVGRKVDIVIVIHYGFLSDSFFLPGVKLSYVKRLISKGAKLIMTACGNDPALQMTYPELCKITELRPQPDNKRYSYLLQNADAIIPTTYSYFAAVKNYCEHYGYSIDKLCHTTPLPITVDDDYTITSCKDREIVIFHGISRPVVKGTQYIKEAMDRIQKEYPDKVECRCEGGLPYSEYVQLFDRIDILIDQTYFNGWGMNAAIGAMKGKCVMAPCGKECREDAALGEIPFVEIGPDVDQIYHALKQLVENPQEIDERKRASRKFVEQYCESSIVAKRFIELIGLN